MEASRILGIAPRKTTPRKALAILGLSQVAVVAMLFIDVLRGHCDVRGSPGIRPVTSEVAGRLQVSAATCGVSCAGQRSVSTTFVDGLPVPNISQSDIINICHIILIAVSKNQVYGLLQEKAKPFSRPAGQLLLRIDGGDLECPSRPCSATQPAGPASATNAMGKWGLLVSCCHETGRPWQFYTTVPM